MYSKLAGSIFLVGLMAQAYISVRYMRTERLRERTLPLSTLAWTIPHGATLLFLATWGFLGLFDGGLATHLAPLAVTPCIIACSQIALRRERIYAYLCKLGPQRRLLIECALLAFYCLVALTLIELPWNSYFCLRGPQYWWLELALLATLVLAFYFVGHRHGFAVAVTTAACFLIGIAQYYVLKFRHIPIMPNDLLALGTAIAVSGQYTLSLNSKPIVSFAIALVGTTILSLLHPAWSIQADGTSRRKVSRDIDLGILSASLFMILILVPNYMQAFGVRVDYWLSYGLYEKQGFFPTFIAIWQDMPIREPEGYSREAAQAATEELADSWREGPASTNQHKLLEAQFAELKPSVIAVMNESFADLSDLDGMHCGYPGPVYFNRIPDALYRGECFVNVYAGSTCNSEFEFLSGNSLGYIGANKYPYSAYSLENVDNLASQFKELGYATTAIHPNSANNWNRKTVYRAWDFDSFLDIDSFGGFPVSDVAGTTMSETSMGYPIFHSGVSDKATYEVTLDLLASSEDPQFIFNVTMQNHGSYDQGNIPPDSLTHYQPEDADKSPALDEATASLNEYLSCIEESDRALEWFIGELRKLDRPVVLVFFGDHQPEVTRIYNDIWFQDEPSIIHSQRIYHTEYIIWANYDVENNDQVSTTRDTSVDALGSILLDAIGVPVNDYEAAQLAVNQRILATNLNGYMGDDGTWYTADQSSPYLELYNKMAMVEYLNFAEKV